MKKFGQVLGDIVFVVLIIALLGGQPDVCPEPGPQQDLFGFSGL